MDESDSAVFNQKEGALIESRAKNQEPRIKSQDGGDDRIPILSVSKYIFNFDRVGTLSS